MFTYFRHNIHEFHKFNGIEKFYYEKNRYTNTTIKNGGVDKMLAMKQLLREKMRTDFPEVKHGQFQYYDSNSRKNDVKCENYGYKK